MARRTPQRRRRRTRTLSSSSPHSRSWRPFGASIEGLPSPGLGIRLRAKRSTSSTLSGEAAGARRPLYTSTPIMTRQPLRLTFFCLVLVRSIPSGMHSVRDRSIREDALPALCTPCPASNVGCAMQSESKNSISSSFLDISLDDLRLLLLSSVDFSC